MFSTKLGDATSGVSESGPGEASFEGSIRTKNGGNYYNRIINNGNKLPGRIEAISIIRNPGELTKLVSKRDQILSKIEDKLTDYVVKCKKRISAKRHAARSNYTNAVDNSGGLLTALPEDAGVARRLPPENRSKYDSIYAVLLVSIANDFYLTAVLRRPKVAVRHNQLIYAVRKQFFPLLPDFASVSNSYAKPVVARERYEEPNGFDWAASIPYHFLLFLIGITYSAINPFINIPCAMYFAMYYFVYRHHFTYVYDCRQFNLGGKSFHLSLRQTFGALYMAEVIWLIMMIVNIKNANLAILRVVLAALTIIATSVVQHYIESYLVPLFTYLPLNACEFIASCLCGESPCICSGHLSISINSPPADTYLQKFDTPSPSLSPQGPPEIKVLPPTEPNSPLFYTPVTSASPPADSPSSASNPSLSAANDLSTTFATSFKHPALKASYFSFIMVPADQTGFCDHIFQKLNHLGQHDDKTYFEVTTTGSIVSTRYKVKLDFNIPEPQPPV
ncbi:putative membrane protein [Zancudomyces culisetae]|uniref:Putative membrane protein n=1 Tax=Zancudomyces culisetae TaxID=1213189 RepID=A0A1R1PM84_ZANCU|nr:putative membrane protein [Zancudomyces culisetae]|eukprot:OMH82078.1 putative membrane protein [Zancudomyces culisetae]